MPEYNLKVGSGSITDQIALILQRLKPIFEDEKPDAVIVYGDTNSTIGGSLTAAHMNIPVIHIEAGERIFLRKEQPEEINRIVTDSISSLCLCSSEKAIIYLKNEGVQEHRMRLVGDTMYDLFLWAQKKSGKRSQKLMKQYGLKSGAYILSTIHRAENTDNQERLKTILNGMDKSKLPVILPLHPRTKKIIEAIDWKPQGALKLVDPMGYLDLNALLQGAEFTITDSGGVSRESFWARKPSIVPMSAPPWLEIEQAGWMTTINPEKDSLIGIMNNLKVPTTYPENLFGDGHAGDKIIQAVYDFVQNPTSDDKMWRQSRQGS